MILRRIKLVGFRKFLDAEFRFGPSINVYLGPNEAGKSTIQKAILTALYGIRDADAGLLPSRDVARSWKPSSRCQLELEYELDGQQFLVRRDILSGKVELLGRDSPDARWNPISEDREDVARRIAEQTGIGNAYVFNRTISVGQADLAKVTADLQRIGDNIEAVFTGETRVGPDEAVAYLDQHFRKPLRKQRNENPGRLDRLEARLGEINQDMVQAVKDDQERAQLASRLEKLDAQIPEKEEDLEQMQRLKDKARKRAELAERLRLAREEFRGIERRIEQIHKAEAELAELNEQRRNLGPIGDMDPEQVLARWRELDAKLWQERNRAEQCTRELEAEQTRLNAALEAHKELQAVEDSIEKFGALGQQDLDEIDQLSRDISTRVTDAEAELRTFDDRIREMNRHLDELRQALNRHPNLGDIDAALTDWHDRLYRRNRCHDQLESTEAELTDHSQKEPADNLPLLIGLLGGTVLGVLWMIASITYFPWLPFWAGLVIAVGTGATAGGLKLLGVIRLHEWRGTYQRLADAARLARDASQQADSALQEFVRKVNAPEDQVEAVLLAHRDAQVEHARVGADLVRCREERLAAARRRDDAEQEGRELAIRVGCSNLAQVQERCGQLRGLISSRANLRRNILAIFGAPATRDPLGLIDEAFAKIKQLSTEQKQLQGHVAKLESHQAQLLIRTGCQDQADLIRQAEHLRELISKRGKAETRLETMLGGKTVAELTNERESKKTELAEVSGRLDEQFAGFEPTTEQRERWQSDYENLTEELKQLHAERNQVDGRLRALIERPGPSLAELEGEKEFVQNEIRRGDETVEAAQMAMKVLGEIKAVHHAEYLPPLQVAASSRFAKMTGGRYSAVRLADIWPRVSVTEAGEQDIEPEYLSGGTSDQLYFALRLAATESLSRRTVLPLILDDPFVNFDPERLAQAMDILAHVAREGRQVILFTHDPRQAEFERTWREGGLQADHVDL